jgi:hypothetical protein
VSPPITAIAGAHAASNGKINSDDLGRKEDRETARIDFSRTEAEVWTPKGEPKRLYANSLRPTNGKLYPRT